MNNKINKKILNNLIKNLEENLCYLTYPEDIFPLSCSDCYFCILNKNNCKKCEYGKIYGLCGDKSSIWNKLYKLVWTLDITRFNKDISIMIYKTYIQKISKSKDVNELMNLQKELIIEIVKLFDNRKNKTIVKKILTIGKYYWNEDPNTNFYVKDLNEVSKIKAINNGFKLDDKLEVVKEVNQEFVEIGQRVKIDSKIYVLTIIDVNRIGLITEDFKQRWDDLYEPITFFKKSETDDTITIKLEDFLKFFNRNEKFKFIKNKEKK